MQLSSNLVSCTDEENFYFFFLVLVFGGCILQLRWSAWDSLSFTNGESSVLLFILLNIRSNINGATIDCELLHHFLGTRKSRLTTVFVRHHLAQ